MRIGFGVLGLIASLVIVACGAAAPAPQATAIAPGPTSLPTKAAPTVAAPPTAVSGPTSAIPPATSTSVPSPAPTVPVASPTAQVATATRTAAPAATATPARATATPAGVAKAPTATAAPTAALGAPAPPFARITTSGGKQFYVRLEIAATPEARSRGLMNRERMDQDAGMLFIFPAEERVSFWMKDTLIPLSIAFISTDGVILEIQDMQPLSEELHQPVRPYRYALEVNQGYFRNNGIVASDRIEFQLGG